MMKEKPDFGQVYEDYYSYVYNYIYTQILHRENTEDLVSDIFMKAMTHYDSYDPSKASPKTWLCNIARNTLIDKYRKDATRQTSSLDAEDAVEPSYEDEYQALKDPINQEVYQILTKLSPEERELISMIYGQDMKNPEIAKVLGISAKAVSERHRRLLQKCRFLEAGKDSHDFF